MTAELPHLPRRRSTVWGGMAVLVLIEATILLSMIASYFYLRTGNLLWPPPGVDAPALAAPGIAHGLVVLSAGAMLLARRRHDAGSRRAFRAALAAALALALAALVLGAARHPTSGFDFRRHAYGAIVWTLAGYQILHLAVVVAMALGLFALDLRGHLRMRRASAVGAIALYWTFVAVASPLTFATLYLTPHVL